MVHRHFMKPLNVICNANKISVNMNKYLKEVIWFFAPIFCSATCLIVFFDLNSPFMFFQSIHIFMELWKGFILMTIISFLLFYIYRIVSKRFENLLANSIFLVVNLLCVISLIYFANFFHNPNIGYQGNPSDSYIKENDAEFAFLLTTFIIFCLIIFEIFLIIKTIKKVKMHSAG